MFTRTIWQYAFREVTVRKGRSVGTALGMAVGIGLFVAMFALADGYHRLILLPFKQLGMDVTIQVSGPDESSQAAHGIRLPPANRPISGSLADRIFAFPEWDAIGRALMLWEHSAKGFSVICGVDLPGNPIGPSRVGEWVTAGRPLERKGQVLLEKHFARVNGLKPGQTMSLGQRNFDIAGIVDLKPENAISKANVYISIQDARDLAGLPPGSANMFFARLKKGLDPDIVRGKLNAVLPGAILTTADNIGQMMKGFGRISGWFAKGLSVLALLFAAVVCHRLLVGSVYERRRDIGVMKAVGWLGRDISRAFTLEALLLGLAGGLAGIVLGYAAACLLGSLEITLKVPWNLSPAPVIAAKTGFTQVRLPIAFSWQTSGLALIVSSLVGAAAGKMVSRKLAAIKPMEAIRDI